jgi:AraC-like DNA-binding protein
MAIQAWHGARKGSATTPTVVPRVCFQAAGAQGRLARRDNSMDFQTFQPGPPLSRFVQYFWLYRNESYAPVRARGLPTGDAQLIFDLSGHGLHAPYPSLASRSQDTVSALFNGADTTPVYLEHDCPPYEIGVQFTPGGAYPFFALPAGDLLDAHVSLEALWGAKATELWERLMETSSAEARCIVLEQALLAHAIRPLERRPVVAFALREFLRAPGRRSIAEVTDQVSLSHARFIQVFRDEVGLSPKLYCRVRRFVCVLQRTYHVERVDWAQLALECGYHDQAHLTHDFHHFAGMTPGVFARDREASFPTLVTLPNA